MNMEEPFEERSLLFKLSLIRAGFGDVSLKETAAKKEHTEETSFFPGTAFASVNIIKSVHWRLITGSAQETFEFTFERAYLCQPLWRQNTL